MDTDIPDTAAPVLPVRRWVQVTTHPCALDADGTVTCWTSPTAVALGLEPDLPSPVQPMTRIWAPGDSHGVGVLAAPLPGEVRTWGCDERYDPPLPDHCSPPSGTPFVATGGGAGLTLAGALVTWTEGGLVPVAGCPQDRSWAHFAGTSGTVYAVATDRTACAYNNPARPPQFLGSFPAALDLEEVAPGGWGVCALDYYGGITCVGAENPEQGFDAPLTFESPPYRRVVGGAGGVCAVRLDWTIECNDGTQLNLGPLRDIAVSNHDAFDPVSGERLYAANARQGLNLCVITESNAIVCEGDRYFEDLMALLPQGEKQ